MKRIIATITLTLTVLLSGGAAVYAQQGDATLELKPSVTSAVAGDEFDVQVVVKNPDQQNIISVRAWLEYDMNSLEGLDVKTDESPFTLAAPGEDGFDSQGHAKIGRSNISGGFKDPEGVVATVHFKVKTASAVNTTINFYDYQVSELGHTSVNIIDAGFPVNILAEEPKEIQIQLNSGAAVTPPVQPEPEVVVPEIGGSSYADLQRPANLKASTGPSYVDLKWDLSNETDLVGYNIYYGKNSGQYTRVRNVGKVNRYRIEDLVNNEVYYFAITAYDNLNRESDYSDEVGVIVNQPLSSTSPFEDILAAMLAKIPGQPQNGPLVGWLVFSAVGLGGAIAFRKKQNNVVTS